MVYGTYLKMAQEKYMCGWVCKESFKVVKYQSLVDIAGEI